MTNAQQARPPIDQRVLDKSPWLASADIRPYVFVRPENRILQPGSRHHCDWFHQPVLLKNPLDLKEIGFADRMYSIEGRAFGPADMAMPRWVFYDCAVMPGFVAGFAARSSSLSPLLRELLNPEKYLAPKSPMLQLQNQGFQYPKSLDEMEWVPLSLFIIIPTMHKGEWVAHNLCSVNSILPKEEQFYGLGFISKAFGLWYSNVELCSGMTQWGGAALKLHSHYGHLELVGGFAPVHSHANTVTYRVEVNSESWERFFDRGEDLGFLEKYAPTEFQVDPKDLASQIRLQQMIEAGEGPFYLSTTELSKNKLGDRLTIYRPKR